MSKVLWFVQHDNGKILKGALAALSAARQLGSVWGCSGVVGVALGAGAESAAQAAAALGVESVQFSEDSLFTKYRAEPYARAVVVAARALDASVVVGLASSTGKDMLPRVAALLDAAQASDVRREYNC
jgi:electron transfer flavoprotein alpha subunit